MATIRSHQELVAWQLSEELKDRVYEITARSDGARDRDFCDDIRRSARSAPANLAEAFGRYRPRDAARFVRIAIASLVETINHLGHASKQRFMSESETTVLITLAKRAKGASCAWLAYLERCPPKGPQKKPKAPPQPPNPEPDPEP
jgi:four helix bundle protein